MKGILIDPHKEEISEVEVGDGIHEIYRVIDANLFDIATLSEDDVMYIDDEGLLKENRYFMCHSFPVLLGGQRNFAGKALILGYNNEGDSFSTQLTVNDVEKRIKWLPEDHVEEPYFQFVEMK